MLFSFSNYFYRNTFNEVAVKINHSCDPNSYVKDLLTIDIMREIKSGEQLTLSHSLFCNSDWKVPGGKCFCGAKNCYGNIVPLRKLSKEDKIKCLSYSSDWILYEETRKIASQLILAIFCAFYKVLNKPKYTL